MSTGGASKKAGHESARLKAQKTRLRFPKWQVTSDCGLLPELPRLFDPLRGDSSTVYRFLIQHHPELDNDTALSALQRDKVHQVLAAGENTAGAFS